jgi:RimJ/RimL family protein N-acetyltransferase
VEDASVPWQLETERLRLRPLVPGDLDALHTVLSDPVSMRFYPEPFDRQKTRAWIDRWISLIRPENVPSWKVARTLGFRPWRGTVRAGMAHVVWSIERPDVIP